MQPLKSNPYASPASAATDAQDLLQQPKVFSLSGRIGRARWLVYNVIYGVCLLLPAVFALGIAMQYFAGLQGYKASDALLASPLLVVVVLVYAVLFFGFFVANKRRLNDLNRSGWWSIFVLVPFINVLMFGYLMFYPGTAAANEYGAAPVKNSHLVVLVASLLILALIGIIGGMVGVLQTM